MNPSTRPFSPYIVRDRIAPGVRLSATAAQVTIAEALRIRARYRAMIAAISPGADAAQATSPNLDAWAASNLPAVRAEVLSGWSDMEASGEYDFATSIWTERDLSRATAELGLSEPMVRTMSANAMNGTVAYLDFLCSGPAYGQGFGSLLVEQAALEARLAGYPAIFTQALAPELEAWFVRRGFLVLDPARDGRPGVLSMSLGRNGR